MALDSFTDELTALHAAEGPSVTRFDAGPAFEGRIAVLPSAFNPPTLAHAHLLTAAASLEGLSGVAALLSTRNVDKGLVGAPLAHRIGMLLAEQRAWPSLAVLATNAARLVDQGAALGQRFQGAEFDFIVGYDTLVRLFDGRYYTDMPVELARFFAHHRVIAANRADVTIAQVAEFIAVAGGAFADRILTLQIAGGPAALSSTQAREAVASQSTSEALSDAVARYVAEHGLYR